MVTPCAFAKDEVAAVPADDIRALCPVGRDTAHENAVRRADAATERYVRVAVLVVPVPTRDCRQQGTWR